MKIKYPFLFQEEILEAKLVKMPSLFRREGESGFLEIIEKFVQIEPPASDCVIICATNEEINSLISAGYKLKAMI